MASKATCIDFLLAQARNATGSLAAGTVTVYEAGTVTPATIWTDRDKGSAAANPYTLDANGTAQLYADGLIKIVIKNSAGSTVYTRDNINYVDYLTSGAYQAIDGDYASLNAAIAAIGATPTTLLIRTADFPMTGAAVVPSTLAIRVEYPGSIDTGGYSLSGIKYATPEMFGAVADWNDSTGTDNTTALQRMFAALATTGGVADFSLVNGAYGITDSIIIASSIKIKGMSAQWVSAGESYPYKGSWLVVMPSGIAGMAGTPILDLSGTGYVTAATNTHIVIEDMNFKVATNDPTANTVGAISDLADATKAGFVTIDHCRFRWFGGKTIELYGNVNTVKHCRTDNINDDAINLHGSDCTIAFNDIGSMQVVSAGTAKSGIYVSGGFNTITSNQIFNSDYGIYLYSSTHNKVIGNRCEKHFNYGIAAVGGSDNLIEDNHVYNDRLGGILLSSSNNNEVSNNYSNYISAVTGNYSDAGVTAYTQLKGIYIDGKSGQNKIDGNFVSSVKQIGIHVLGTDGSNLATNNVISNNTVYAAGQQTTDTYPGIYVEDYATGNDVSYNRVIDGVTRTSYGIRIAPGTGSINTFNSTIGNSLDGAGATASLSNASPNGASSGNIGDKDTTYNSNAITASSATLDLSTFRTSQIDITLPATTLAITAVTMPAYPVDSQKVTLRFKQGGTSASSVAGFPASVHFAGSSFSLTATVDKIDVVVLEYSARESVWHEVSRAMNQ